MLYSPVLSHYSSILTSYILEDFFTQVHIGNREKHKQPRSYTVGRGCRFTKITCYPFFLEKLSVSLGFLDQKII